MPNPLVAAQALEALKKSQNPQVFDPSELELYGLSHRSPETVSPGSNEYWGSELKQRQEDSDKFKNADIANVLATGKSQNDASNAGFVGNPVYKDGSSSYSSGNPSMDNIGPTTRSPVQSPTLSPGQQMGRYGLGLERAKVEAPVDQARVQAQGNIDVAHINKDALAGNMNQLAGLLGSNKLPPSSEVDLPGGGRIRIGSPPVNNPLAKEEAAAIDARGKLDDPSIGEDTFRNIAHYLGLGVQTLAQKRAVADANIARVHGAAAPAPNHTPTTGGMVRMIHPDGTAGQVPQERVNEALAKGYRIAQ